MANIILKRDLSLVPLGERGVIRHGQVIDFPVKKAATAGQVFTWFIVVGGVVGFLIGALTL